MHKPNSNHVYAMLCQSQNFCENVDEKTLKILYMVHGAWRYQNENIVRLHSHLTSDYKLALNIRRTMNKNIFVSRDLYMRCLDDGQTFKHMLLKLTICLTFCWKRRANNKCLLLFQKPATTHVHCSSQRSALQIWNLLGIYKNCSTPKAYHFTFCLFYIMQFDQKINAVSAFSQC